MPTAAEDERTAVPPLVVDAMLARLGRWLRLLGVDAEDGRADDDDDLIASMRGSGRTLLTRHRRRAARIASAGLDVLLLAASDLGGQIREIRGRHVLPRRASWFTRCSECNEPLSPVSRDEASGWVPPFVASRQSRFARCARCGRVYWRSTHAERFALHLARLLGDDAKD